MLLHYLRISGQSFFLLSVLLACEKEENTVVNRIQRMIQSNVRNSIPGIVLLCLTWQCSYHNEDARIGIL